MADLQTSKANASGLDPEAIYSVPFNIIARRLVCPSGCLVDTIVSSPRTREPLWGIKP